MDCLQNISKLIGKNKVNQTIAANEYEQSTSYNYNDSTYISAKYFEDLMKKRI